MSKRGARKHRQQQQQQQPPTQGRHSLACIALVVAAVVVVVAFAVPSLWYSGGDDALRRELDALAVAEPPGGVREVTHMWVGPDEPVFERVAESRVPVLVHGSAASAWVGNWGPNDVARHPLLRTFTGVSRQSHPTFTYYESGAPLANNNVMSPLWRKPVEMNMRMNARSFFALLDDRQSHSYVYQSGEMPDTVLQSLHGARHYWPPTVAKPDYAGFWMSGKQSITACHYDTEHNLFVQLHGRKRFLLLEPTEHSRMYAFPRLSPHFRQSQVNFTHPQSDLYPDFDAVKPIEVWLNPGDVLYVPPMYWHHVEAPETSVSVNFWTRDPNIMSMDDALLHPMPVEPSFEAYDEVREFVLSMNHVPPKQVEEAIQVLWMQMFASHAEGSSSGEPDAEALRRLTRQLLRERYEPLVTRAQSREEGGAGEAAEEGHVHGAADREWSWSWTCANPLRGSEREAAVTLLQPIMEDRVGPAFARLRHHAAVWDARVRQWAHSYVEDCAAVAVGAENVWAFLSTCVA